MVHRHLGEEGRNQTKSAQPRHTQGLNHFRTDQSHPRCPRLRQGGCFILGGSWTRGKKQDAYEKKKWVKGQNSAVSLLHAPPFLSKQSLCCYPVVNVPQNGLASSSTWNTLGKEPETTPSWQLLWRQGEQLHRLGHHKIHPEDKEPMAHVGLAPRPCTLCRSCRERGYPWPSHCCLHTASADTKPRLSKTSSHLPLTSWGAVAIPGLLSELTRHSNA